MGPNPHDVVRHPQEEHAGGFWEKAKIILRIAVILVVVGAVTALLTRFLDQLEGLKIQPFEWFLVAAKCACYAALGAIVILDLAADFVQAWRREVISSRTHARGVFEVVKIAVQEALVTAFAGGVVFGALWTIAQFRLPAGGPFGLFSDLVLSCALAVLWGVMTLELIADIGGGWRRFWQRVCQAV